MIDHYSIPVSDFVRSKNFYDKSLVHLGYECIMDFETDDVILAGYGEKGKPSFWVGQSKLIGSENGESVASGFINGLHIGFLAPSSKAVDEWYLSCLEHGGKCNGKLGIRHYHDGYYGAFILDPDGWKIEACVHDYTMSAER